MKYIKKYKIFESTNNILEDLNDICLEIKDSGLDVSILHSGADTLVALKIDTFKSFFNIKIESLKGTSVRKLFDFNDDVQTTIIRINQYMRELGFRTTYRAGSHDFVVRPDEKLRYMNGLWISNTDQVLAIELTFWK